MALVFPPTQTSVSFDVAVVQEIFRRLDVILLRMDEHDTRITALEEKKNPSIDEKLVLQTQLINNVEEHEKRIAFLKDEKKNRSTDEEPVQCIPVQARLIVLAIPVVLSIMMLAVADYTHEFKPMENWGCLPIVVVFVAIIVFEQRMRAVPYIFGATIFVSVWKQIQPSIFAMRHASIWINIMTYTRLLILAADGNVVCFLGATRDLGKAVY